MQIKENCQPEINDCEVLKGQRCILIGAMKERGKGMSSDKRWLHVPPQEEGDCRDGDAVSEIQETCPALSPEEQARQIFAFHTHHFINVDKVVYYHWRGYSN